MWPNKVYIRWVNMNATTTARFLFAAALAFSGALTLPAQPAPLAAGQTGFSFSSTATASGEAKLKVGDTSYEHVLIDQSLGLGDQRQLTLVFGVAYNSFSKDFKLIPIIGGVWRPSEQCSVALGFPKAGVT